MTQTLFPDSISSAVFSPCRQYRYELSRFWGPSRYLGIIGLNPSTADEYTNDNTIRKEIAFAKLWGFNGLVKANLYAWRSTDPRVLKRVADPVGPENDAAIIRVCRGCSLLMAAWGINALPGRDTDVCRMIEENGFELHCFGTTKYGHPKHPLYLPASTPAIPFSPPSLGSSEQKGAGTP